MLFCMFILHNCFIAPAHLRWDKLEETSLLHYPNHDSRGVQNIGLTHMDETHNFVKLYNATSKNETENEHLNESIYPNNDNICKYYTPDELIKTKLHPKYLTKTK